MTKIFARWALVVIAVCLYPYSTVNSQNSPDARNVPIDIVASFHSFATVHSIQNVNFGPLAISARKQSYTMEPNGTLRSLSNSYIIPRKKRAAGAISFTAGATGNFYVETGNLAHINWQGITLDTPVCSHNNIAHNCADGAEFKIADPKAKSTLLIGVTVNIPANYATRVKRNSSLIIPVYISFW